VVRGPQFEKRWLRGFRRHFNDRCVLTPDKNRHSVEGSYYICISKFTFHYTRDTWSTKIIKLETTRSLQQAVVTLVSW
jgi:hypothetical protein